MFEFAERADVDFSSLSGKGHIPCLSLTHNAYVKRGLLYELHKYAKDTKTTLAVKDLPHIIRKWCPSCNISNDRLILSNLLLLKKSADKLRGNSRQDFLELDVSEYVTNHAKITDVAVVTVDDDSLLSANASLSSINSTLRSSKKSLSRSFVTAKINLKKMRAERYVKLTKIKTDLKLMKMECSSLRRKLSLRLMAMASKTNKKEIRKESILALKQNERQLMNQIRALQDLNLTFCSAICYKLLNNSNK